MEEIVSRNKLVILKDSLINIRQQDSLLEATEYKTTRIQQEKLQA